MSDAAVGVLLLASKIPFSLQKVKEANMYIVNPKRLRQIRNVSISFQKVFDSDW